MAPRTLERPPSDRYAPGGEVSPSAPPGATVPDAPATGRRAEVGGVVAAVVTAAVLVVLGGILGLTTGLLFVAGVGGALTGLLLAASPRPRSRLRTLAIGLAISAVLVGAVGGWLIAIAEGGSLGLADYLWAMTGLLVPVEAVVAALAAAWGVSAGPIVP